MSQSWTHWTHSAHSNILLQHKKLRSALWRVSLMKQFKQRLTALCKVFILEICKIIIFFFPVSGGATFDKVTTSFFLFLFLFFVLHLNVLVKHNKWNLWQVNTSFIALFISKYFEEFGLSDRCQGTERCIETDSTQQSSMYNSSQSIKTNNLYVYTRLYILQNFYLLLLV